MSIFTCRCESMRDKGRSVTDQPQMSKWIKEAALSMNSPWHLMIPYRVKIAACTCLHCTRHDGVRIITEHLNSRGGDSQFGGAFPAIVRGFAQKKWRTGNLQASH